mmetsp:Transcript_18963/g.52909  ORF Transcript_18963/g.52909 Transcript_18963/m.52909 type:complete len:83 (-) Transcript_18963:17-265(-)
MNTFRNNDPLPRILPPRRSGQDDDMLFRFQLQKSRIQANQSDKSISIPVYLVSSLAAEVLLDTSYMPSLLYLFGGLMNVHYL